MNTAVRFPALAGSGHEKALEPSDYYVSKIIERNQTKVGSQYPEHYEVTCTTAAGTSPEVLFVWEIRIGGFGIEKFRWGWAPGPYDDE